ncbi:MAG: tetratricopeptide repeat protein [bacterium]|nr:tetratricopeptide repeat protein [bacterium]
MGKRVVLIILLMSLASGCGGNLSQQKLDDLEKLPYTERVAELEALQEKHPLDHRLPALLARTIWETFDNPDPFQKAEVIKQALRENPEDAIVSKLLGDAFYDLSLGSGGPTYLDSALFAYENAALKNSNYLGAIGSAGSIYDEQSDYDQAIYWYNRALEIDPEHVPTLCNIGASHYNNGDYEISLDFYRKALVLDPDSQDAHYNLGVAFAEAQIYQEAVREWETVARIDSTSAVGIQAKENAALLRDVIAETIYKRGRKVRTPSVPPERNSGESK